MIFRVQSIPEISSVALAPNQYGRALQVTAGSTIVVSLPMHAEAVHLLECYSRNVDYLVRVLHIPTVRNLLNNFYANLNRSQQVKSGEAALLLAIFASSSFFWRPSSNTGVVSLSDDETVLLSLAWAKAALDVLDHSRRNTSGSLEDAQATILMSFVVYHFDGFSARGRALTGSAVVIARDLRLHRTDEDDSRSSMGWSKNQLIEQETKRRVWWHIASTDWCVYGQIRKKAANRSRLLSFMGGPQEGLYSIQPRQMNVQLPMDCDDEHVGEFVEERISSHANPTSMSYYHQRIRLAELSREIVDTVPFPISRLKVCEYDRIVSLDSKLLSYLDQLPVFFRIDPNTHEALTPADEAHPYLPIIRYYITVTTHSRRCRLHQPFLIRQHVDSRYEYSRTACLDSARIIIHMQKSLRQGMSSPTTLHQRLSTVVHFVFLALVVSVMDVCFNRAAGEDAFRTNQVTEAFKILQDAKSHSILAGKLLNSLFETLQKHKIRLPHLQDSYGDVSNGQTSGSISTATSTTLGTIEHKEPPPTPVINMQLDPGFDNLFESAMQGSPNLDMPSWDQLFSDIDIQTL